MKSVAQEGRKVKPIPPTTPSHFTDRKTSRTNLTSLKPAEDFFLSFPLNSFFLSVLFSFFIPSSFHPLLFHSIFLPSFIFFILIFVKIPHLSSHLFLLLPPSYLPFSMPLFPLSFSFFFLLSPFPTGETIKPGAMKRPELDPVRLINVSSRPVSTGD